MENNNNTNLNPPTTQSFGTRRAALHPDFQAKLWELRLPLYPLVSETTLTAHPSFPRTRLAFWLLTEAELDALAHFYHQSTPCAWTHRYPMPVHWPRQGLRVEDKRRKFGRFIGMRGMESPSCPSSSSSSGSLGGSRKRKDSCSDDGEEWESRRRRMSVLRQRTEEQIEEDARRARAARDDEINRKMGWY
ncbi:hypothetical protein B0T22DRAFT_476640 [Podospora appendiculata]|uniref:Uncharacterized protein n=1 Tax=Podospora appendiculata TaxID=314037 RepID=A0AAE0XIZ9_9PEZI|nr:hypothetical protein B0T22DRAFT_476640 [Podospora appendiculata]